MKQLSYRNLPKVSSLPTPSSSLEGVLVELTTDSHLYYCNGTQWIDVVGDTLETVVARGATTTTPIAISVNSATDGLKITQTGTGNALVVEDSTSPDSSPFAIDAAGRLLIGGSTSATGGAIQLQTTDVIPTSDQSRRSSTGTGVVSQDNITGQSRFYGFDGSAFIRTSQIQSAVDGVPNTTAMPGRLAFLTNRGGKFTISSISRASNVVTVTASTGISDLIAVGDTVLIENVTDSSYNGSFTITSIPTSSTFTFTQSGTNSSSSGGSATVQQAGPVERLRIDSRGKVVIGSGGASGINTSIYNSRNITGGSQAAGYYSNATILSDVTTTASGVTTELGTSGTFTLLNLQHYHAKQGSFDVNSAVTYQYGFIAHNSLTGAANNYGFYSDIAEAVGRWNFYANGTAKNYFAGQTAIGTNAPSASAKLQVDSTTQGFLPPRMTTTQRDAITSPASGLEIFNTTSNTKQYYNGSSWVNLTASGGSSGVVVTTITVDTGSTPSTSTIHTITDATVTSSSTVIANVSMTTTADNSLDDHQHAVSSWKLSCQSGNGQFDLYIDALADMYWGTFKINYIVY